MKIKKPKLARASKSMMTSVERLTTAPERIAIIKSCAGKIIPVDKDTPVGYVDLSFGEQGFHRFSCLIVAMLDELKVAVGLPYWGNEDPTYKVLDDSHAAYGMWGPFSDVQLNGLQIYGGETDMILKRRSGWKLKCYANDGTIALVPLPRRWADADSKYINKLR